MSGEPNMGGRLAYVCMCVCVCVYIYIYIYISVCVCASVCACVGVGVCARARACVCARAIAVQSSIPNYLLLLFTHFCRWSNSIKIYWNKCHHCPWNEFDLGKVILIIWVKLVYNVRILRFPQWETGRHVLLTTESIEKKKGCAPCEYRMHVVVESRLKLILKGVSLNWWKWGFREAIPL